MKRIAFTLAALLCGTSAHAQQSTAPEAMAPPSSEEGDEIVVTANKRQQNIQDVGMAVTAIGGNALAQIGRQEMTALAAQVPSLKVNQYSPTSVVFNIRGVSQNDFTDSQEAPIAFYADEVYVSALGAISGQTFDLERVEVLRGPQGTLFGRNATGGLVQIVSAKPTRELSGFLTLTAGSYGQIATEGAISGPLTDWLRARLSFTTNNHGGYIKNRIGPDLGNSKFYGLRVQVAADIGADGVFSLKVQRLRNNKERSGGLYSWAAARPGQNGLGQFVGRNEDAFGSGPGADPFGYVEPDDDPFTGSYDRIGFFDRTVTGVTGRYVHTLDAVTLTAITDYQEMRKLYGEDTDMSPNAIFNYDTAQKLRQISQEVRLSHDGSDFTWVLGGYGLRITSDNDYQIDSPAGVLPRQNFGGRLVTTSWAVFGQGEYKVSPTLSLILGGRFSSDRKRLDYRHATDGVIDFVFNPATNPDLASKRFDDWSGKAQVNYKPNRDLLLYIGVNRGTKSGGFGTQAFTPIDPQTVPFGGEVLTNYEGGFKWTVADGAADINMSAFHYDYNDYQAFSTINVSQFVTNNDATVDGAELELFVRPVTGLSLQGSVSYLDSNVTGIRLPDGTIADRRMPQSPRWSVGWGGSYKFDVGRGKLMLQSDWKYDAEQFFSTFNAPVDRERARVVGNARISYTLHQVEAAVFVSNITDRAYRVYNLDLSGALGVTNQAFARPRWFGASLTYRLN